MAKRQSSTSLPIGERLRAKRVEALAKGLREMARFLDIAPAHLTDIENGRRNPSEDLLVRIAKAYQFPEADLRAAFAKPQSIVSEIASQSALAVEKVPELLRTARGLSADQWDRLIKQAKRISSEEKDSKG